MLARRVATTSFFSNVARATSKATFVPASYMSFTKLGMTEGIAAPPKASKPAAEPKVNRGTRPLLSTIIRQLYLRIHPDHFAMYPEQQKVNEQSMMTLQGFLSSLKSSSATEKITYVKNERLYFFIRGEQPGHFRKAELVLHYTGGSKEIVYNMLNKFFIQVGLADGFTWDSMYWPRKLLTREDKEDIKSRSAAEKNESFRGSYDQDGKFNNSNESFEDFQERIKHEASKQ